MAFAPADQLVHREALPGVVMMRKTLDGGLARVIPHRYGTVVHVEGESEWSVLGSRYATRPGTVGVKVPGDVYAEHVRHGRSSFEVVFFDDALVEEARSTLERSAADPRARSFDGASDARVVPLLRLHGAMDDATSTPEALAQALSDALVTLVELTSLPAPPESGSRWSEAVRRARLLLDERSADTVSLDELAAHAGLDKFRLVRAFHEQIGLPPYAYLTHRRVYLAQQLLARGLPQAEVAARVGLYDQSQLHRHFKRILGVTPGAYARAVR